MRARRRPCALSTNLLPAAMWAELKRAARARKYVCLTGQAKVKTAKYEMCRVLCIVYCDVKQWQVTQVTCAGYYAVQNTEWHTHTHTHAQQQPQ